MEQIFNNSVGQVAGKNIYNFGTVPYESIETNELRSRQQAIKQDLRASRKRIFCSIYLLLFSILLLGGGGSAFYLLSSGQLFNIAEQIPLWCMIIYMVALLIVAFLFVRMREREDVIIADCKAHLSAIDIALNKRGLR